MRNRVRREVRQIAESNGPERLGVCTFEDLLADVPVVGVPADRGVFFGEGDVRRDGAVEEWEAVPFEEALDRGREKVERREDRLTDGDVGRGAPRPRLFRSEKEPDRGPD
ncbi:MAG: hypothetical protein WEG36_06925 [Gemmatimonadota bacterium]